MITGTHIVYGSKASKVESSSIAVIISNSPDSIIGSKYGDNQANISKGYSSRDISSLTLNLKNIPPSEFNISSIELSG